MIGLAGKSTKSTSNFMYQWNYKNTFIHLTDEEENELLKLLSNNNVLERWGYNINRKKRKYWEKNINKYLKDFYLKVQMNLKKNTC